MIIINSIIIYSYLHHPHYLKSEKNLNFFNYTLKKPFHFLKLFLNYPFLLILNLPHSDIIITIINFIAITTSLNHSPLLLHQKNFLFSQKNPSHLEKNYLKDSIYLIQTTVVITPKDSN
jgi:hypothetical protein